MALKTNPHGNLPNICQVVVPSWWGRRGITGLPKGGEFFTAEFRIFYDFNKENVTIAVPCFFKTYFNFLSKISTQLQVSFSSELFKTSYIDCVVVICTFLSKAFFVWGVKHFFMS